MLLLRDITAQAGSRSADRLRSSEARPPMVARSGEHGRHCDDQCLWPIQKLAFVVLKVRQGAAGGWAILCRLQGRWYDAPSCVQAMRRGRSADARRELPRSDIPPAPRRRVAGGEDSKWPAVRPLRRQVVQPVQATRRHASSGDARPRRHSPLEEARDPLSRRRAHGRVFQDQVGHRGGLAHPRRRTPPDRRCSRTWRLRWISRQSTAGTRSKARRSPMSRPAPSTAVASMPSLPSIPTSLRRWLRPCPPPWSSQVSTCLCWVSSGLPSGWPISWPRSTPAIVTALSRRGHCR